MKRIACFFAAGFLLTAPALAQTPAVDGAAPQGEGPSGTPVSRELVDRMLAAPLRDSPSTAKDRRGMRSSPPRLTADGFGYAGMSADGTPVSQGAPEGMAEVVREHNDAPPAPEGGKSRSARPVGQAEKHAEPRQPSDRKVIGSDERTRIYETAKYPFSAFGYLYMEFANGSAGRCSGTVIGPSLVLTAGHCVYDDELGSYATRILFLPGMSGEEAPFGYFEASSWVAPTGYQTDTGRTGPQFFYDIAVIQFKDQIAQRTGSIGYGYDDNQPPFAANIVQYPADLDGRYMWIATCDVGTQNIARDYMEYACDTYGGSSGSSVYELTTDDKRIIHAVHSRGNDQSNAGVRMTRAHYEWIRNYR